MEVFNISSFKKNNHVKKIRIFARICFACYLVVYGYFHITDYAVAPLKRTMSYVTLAHKSKNSSVQIDINVNNDTKIYSFGSGIVSLDTDFASFINLIGTSEADIALGYTSPNIAFGKNQAVIYNLGSTDYLIANSFGILSENKTNARILGLYADDISENYAIITDDTGFNNVLRVYNANSNEIFKWSTSTYSIIKATLYGDMLSVLAIKQEGLDFKSYLISFNLKSDIPLFEYEFVGDMPIDMHIFEDRNIAVIFDNKITYVNKSGEHEKTTENLALKSYNLNSHHNMTYATNNFDDTYTLTIVDTKGAVQATTTIYEKVNSITKTNRYIYVLTQNTLYKYDYYFNLIETAYTEVNILNIIAFSNDMVYAVYSNELKKLF